MNAPASLTRRQFLTRTTIAGVAVAGVGTISSLRGADAPANKLCVAIMGSSGRGTDLAGGLASLAGVEVTHICDVDDRNIAKGIAAVEKKGRQSRTPAGARDFRRVLDDKNVDVLVIATPDHWHAPAAILGCAAGKHIYVEKPCCHNPHEGELLVQAAAKYKRLVQHGTQRRSWPAMMEAVDKLRAGAIGRVLFAKALYFGPRGTIGKGKTAPVPGWLDWDLWQGPAPLRPYRDNVVHYNWHWFWHWGTGELGNNAVHFLDLCRWALNVDYPAKVTCSGGKYGFPDDDQETPDTTVASFDFANLTINWEQRSWAPRAGRDPKFDVAFYGDKGVLTVTGSGYDIQDVKGNPVGQGSGSGSNEIHLQNLLDAIRNGTKLNAPIDEGYKSTLLCHLANIAWRTGRTVEFDAVRKTARDRSAQALWQREYRKGWAPKV